MSKVDLLDKDGNTYRPDVFVRQENGVDVLTQAVANVNPDTGTPTDFATETTLAALKTVTDNLLIAANEIKTATEALDTNAISGTVALDASSLEALETINTGGLTDAQLRASALNVLVSNPTSNITGYATETTLAQVKSSLDAIASNTDTVEPLLQAISNKLPDLTTRNDEFLNYLKTEDSALGVDGVQVYIPHPDYPTQIDPSQTVKVGGLTRDGFLKPQVADVTGAQILSDAPIQTQGVGYNTAGGSIVANLDTQGYQSISLQLSGVFVGTVSFYGSNDGRDWFALAGYVSGGGGTPVTSATTSGLWIFPALGRYFKAQLTAYTSGTVQAATFLRNQPMPMLASTMAVNTAQIAGTAPVNAGVAGVQAIGGNVAIGAAPTVNPVNIGGWDGKLTRRLLTNPDGAVATYSVPQQTQYSSDSVTDLLGVLVKEMQILNRLICEFASLGDADAQLREDVTFKNLFIN